MDIQERIRAAKVLEAKSLDISGFDLEEIPREIFELEHLKELDFSKNAIRRIPSELKRLRKLEVLKASNNKLHGIPDVVTKLFRLKELYLNNNKISDVSTEIADLEELEVLDLSYNRLKEFPASLTQLRLLKVLRIAHNEFGILPESISFLHNLTSLDISFNQVKELNKGLNEIKGLNELRLLGNPLKHPPIEVANQGMEAIALFFKDLAEKEKYASQKNFLIAIAIDDYPDVLSLNNSVQPVKAIVEILHERFLFEEAYTYSLINEEASRNGILRLFNELAGRIGPEDNLLIIFSGHGFTDPEMNQSFWLPYDAESKKRVSYLDLATVVYFIRSIRTTHTILINDSAFDDSYIQRSRKAGGKRDDNIPSRWVLSSGKEDIVPDGPAGQVSPFMQVLLQLLRNTNSDLWITDIFQSVLQSVSLSEPFTQLPIGNPLAGAGDQGGEFLLRLREQEEVSIDVDYAQLEKDKLNADKQKEGDSPKTLEFVNLEELKYQLKDNLASDLGGTLEIANEIYQSSRNRDLLILLRGRYKNVSYQIAEGTIHQDLANIELNRIGQSLMSLINQIELEDIDGSNLQSLEKLNRFINSPLKADKELWEEASLVDSIEAYQTYLRESKENIYQSDANQRIRELRQAEEIQVAREEHDFWNEKRKEDSINAYTDYLETYPEGAFAGEANTYIKKIRTEEETLWMLTESKGSQEAYEAYLLTTKTNTYRETANDKIQSFELQSGDVNVYEAKLILVGNGRVGKTSLSKRFIGQDFDLKERSTHGIRIRKWEVPLEEKVKLKLNIWDFGGQEIYHATHRFFLTNRALYLLVWDKVSNDDAIAQPNKEENFRFEYWLESIKTLSNSSPVIMVQNKIDIGRDYIDNPRALIDSYNVKEFCDVSAANETALLTLEKSIVQEFTKGEELKGVIGYKLPQKWIKVRTEIENIAQKKPYITYSEYIDICKKEEVEEDSAEVLSQFLHEIGVILHFTKPEVLYEILILNPSWATNVIYKILNDQIKNNKGIFTRKDLDKFWDEVPTENRVVSNLEKWHEKKVFLELMKKFEICFEIANSDPKTYVVPQFLPSLDKSVNWNYQDNLRIGFKYDFLHKHIFMRLMVRLSERLQEDCFWKDDMLIHFHGKLKALISTNKQDQFIDVKIDGPDSQYKRFFLNTIIRPRLLKVQEPLSNTEIIPCDACGGYLTRDFVEENLRNGITETLCPNDQCRNKIELDKLWVAEELSLGSESEQDRQAHSDKGVKVFISYSHKDESYKDNLVEHLSGMQRSGIINGWQDRQILPGEKWDDEIKKELDAAEIVLFLVSASFMASDYIHDVEISRAMEKHEAGEIEIVPVIVRPCDFNSLELSKYQALPKGARPILTWDIPDEAYLDVVQQLKAMIHEKFS